LVTSPLLAPGPTALPDVPICVLDCVTSTWLLLLPLPLDELPLVEGVVLAGGVLAGGGVEGLGRGVERVGRAGAEVCERLRQW